MHPVLLKALRNAFLTAVALALVGLLFAELVGHALANIGNGKVPDSTQTSFTALRDDLRVRLPVLMSAWGFAFVLIGEGLLYLWRGGRKPAENSQPTPSPEISAPDPAEVLLEELLGQADAAAQARQKDEVPQPSIPAANQIIVDSHVRTSV